MAIEAGRSMGNAANLLDQVVLCRTQLSALMSGYVSIVLANVRIESLAMVRLAIVLGNVRFA